MALLDDILAWTQTLPEWQQDAARRLFQKPERLSNEDYDALYALLKAAHNLPNPEGLKAVPLSKDHLPASTGNGDTVVLKAMRDLKHVNCIAPNQVLSFEPTGMTVIYGGNGSGKSGYARVLKRACRARDQNEQVLPDANDPAAQRCTPEAVFDIEAGGAPKEVKWSSKTDPPEELASIAVFDCHCARLYLTKEQEVAYLPYGLDIVEALANTVLPELERRLNQEVASISTDSTQFANLLGETAVGHLIAGLSHKTDPDEVKKLATLSDEDTQRAAELDRTLGEADPAAKAKDLRLSAQRLKEVVQRLDAATAVVDVQATEKLKKVVQDARDAELAEKAAVDLLRSGESLLPGTGESAWKALFEAARKFSVGQAYPDRPFPNTDGEALCVLCQQPMQNAADRMTRFEKYVQDDVAKTAAAKQKTLAATVEQLRQANLTIGIQGALADELNQLDQAISGQITTFETAISNRRRKILDAATSQAWDSLPGLDDSLRQTLRNLAARQYRRSRDYQKACDEARAAALKKERASLLARKALSLCQEQVLALLDRLKKKHALEGCRSDLNTKPISLKSRDLASTVVTSELKDALDREFRGLGMEHRNTKLKQNTVKGQIRYRLVLDVPTSSKVEDILSEGEQRAIAVGSFLAELALASHSAAIVFDDPVSSLDHVCRRKVARRLVKEARNRQVVVFTHEVTFWADIVEECKYQQVEIGHRYLRRGRDHAGECVDQKPWHIMKLNDRIGYLKEKQQSAATVHGTKGADAYEPLGRELYGLLRESWERAVEEVLLNETVMRLGRGVQTMRLRKVTDICDADVQCIDEGMSKCSRFLTGHDEPAVVQDPVPGPEEVIEDIKALEDWAKTVRCRRN